MKNPVKMTILNRTGRDFIIKIATVDGTPVREEDLEFFIEGSHTWRLDFDAVEILPKIKMLKFPEDYLNE